MMMVSKADFLTLPTVFPNVALLTQAVVFSARSPVHAADVTVLDCGESNTHTHTYLVQRTHASQQHPEIIPESHGQI